MRLVGTAPTPVIARVSAPIVNRAVDITKARGQLGFEPISLEAGVRETVDWFTREGLL
jgi:nucleoside-diphosphate-sugar epimerase